MGEVIKKKKKKQYEAEFYFSIWCYYYSKKVVKITVFKTFFISISF